MGNFWLVTCILAMVATVAVNSAPQHHPNPPMKSPTPTPPGADCTTLIHNMVDCIPFVRIGSEEAKPVAACCSGLKKVIDIDVECICQGLKSSADLGFDLNMTKAKTLPSACGVSGSAPPIGSSSNTKPPSASPPPPTAPPPEPHKSAAPPVTPVAKAPTPPPTTTTGGGGGGGLINKTPTPSPLKSRAYALSNSFAFHFSTVVVSLFYILA